VYFENERTAKQIIAESGFPAFLGTLPVWGKKFPVMRNGDTGIGFTFEQLLGVQENNLRLPDFHGYEVKTNASSQAQITLFTKNPTAPVRAVHKLLDRYGKSCDGINRFNTNLIVGRKTAFGDTFLTLDFNRAMRQFEVVSGDCGVVAYWTWADIEASASKLDKLMFCPAASLVEAGQFYVIYSGCELYNDLDMQLFLNSFCNGRVSVNFRIKGTLEKARNKGAAFRMNARDIKLIYHLCTVWP
jgi:hypothetical protein